MTFLSDARDLVGIAAAIAGVGGGYIALMRYLEDRNRVRAEAKSKLRMEQREAFRQWQQVAVHKIIQSEEKDPVDFRDILQRYQQEAIALEEYATTPADLGADTLRRVILDMVSAGILKQVGIDQYEIKQKAN